MSDALIDNASDKEQVRAAEKKYKRTADQAKADLAWLMEQPPFQRWARRFTAHCGIFRAVYDENPVRMALNDGRRQVALWFLDTVSRVRKDAVTTFIAHPTTQENTNG